ncbi:MAG: restriction endonuclease subunit S [Candidatus Omnitrophica bacterium]|nr:restriction endonuclease subunit S [Candidatus Omnitrophota bacterium]
MAQIQNLKTENKFKKTEIGDIPVDWEIAELGKITQIVMGQSPPSSTYFDYENGIPFFQGKAEFGVKYPKITKWCNEPRKLAEKDDTLISVRAPVGDVNIAPEKCCIGRGLAAIRGVSAYNNFIYFVMFSARDILAKIGQGSTFEAINKDVLFKLKVTVPPIREQQKIAKILSTVDDAIDKSGKVTEKTKQLKRGLMQELLSHGIGHKKFKKTKIGEIPSHWKVAKIENCCDILDSQRIPLNDVTRRDMKGPFPYYGANGLLDSVNKYIFDDDLILMAEDGGYFDEYKTRPIAYLVNGKCWVNNHAHVLRAKKEYCREWIYYSIVHKNILQYIGGGTRAKLNQKELRAIPILAPPLFEQKQIAEILSSVDDRIEKENVNKEWLEKLKKGLMQVLLTGKVRVKI